MLAEQFASLGLRTVGDLLNYFPFRHEAEAVETDIEHLRLGQRATIRGEIIKMRTSRGGARTCTVHDGTDICILRWFNTNYMDRRIAVGAIVIASGKIEEFNGRAMIVHPTVQVFPPDSVVMSPQQRGRRQLGVYRGSSAIKSQTIRKAVLRVLDQPHLPVEDITPPELVRKHGLLTREAAVRGMHTPRNDDQFEQARTRLAYDEFLLMELAIALRRRKTVSLEEGRMLHVTAEIDKRIRARFPFQLTPSQNAVIKEISRDLQSGRPMTRLLQGDVGSGKTVVALHASLAAIANGRQAAIMAPTEILAQQHFDKIEKYLGGSKVKFALLSGKQPKKQRDQALADIQSGKISLVVGTQALIQKGVAFADLAMITVDEQHKFGVVQRATFRTKGPTPHYLVMTATPIPRTLSMTVFGDLDVSIIKRCPPGRGKVTTRVVSVQKWDVVAGYVRERLERGEQAFVVCPVIGEKEKATRHEGGSAARGVPLTSVKETYDKLTSGPWRGLSVALLHGAMRPADKRAIMDDFAAGKTHALVATTVVEVGVDVANATIMIVEHAERYGLSQLHQLRGRIGRGGKDSLCVLIAHGRGEKAAERLDVIANTTDGFKIAEADLALRGPGELLGTRQHGLPELRVGDIVNDFALLAKARSDAFEIVGNDPQLRRPQHERMIPALKRMFGDKLALIDAA